jgi:hypothetical protein
VGKLPASFSLVSLLAPHDHLKTKKKKTKGNLTNHLHLPPVIPNQISCARWTRSPSVVHRRNTVPASPRLYEEGEEEGGCRGCRHCRRRCPATTRSRRRRTRASTATATAGTTPFAPGTASPPAATSRSASSGGATSPPSGSPSTSSAKYASAPPDLAPLSPR